MGGKQIAQGKLVEIDFNGDVMVTSKPLSPKVPAGVTEILSIGSINAGTGKLTSLDNRNPVSTFKQLPCPIPQTHLP